MMVKYIVLGCAFLVLSNSGCAASSQVEKQPATHEIQILGRDQIEPFELYVYVGEEIRWNNRLDTPVHLGFLSTRLMDEPGCEKGFTTWIGTVRDLVTIDPGGFVSLCFGRPGTIRYNVWTDMDDPVHSMSPTAVIHSEEAA